MKDCARDLVYRMMGDDASAEAVADICQCVVDRIDAGDVCVPIEDRREIDLLKSAKGVVSVLPDDAAPFVLSGSLLYTRRNWRYELNVIERLKALSKGDSEAPSVEIPNEEDFNHLSDEQRVAVVDMNTSRFSILTGGPGTGKTYTIARAVKLFMRTKPDLRLALAAPTGKAANRMTESLSGIVKDGEKAVTIHRLLGSNQDFVTFKHGKENPLAIDWLIVDEASMIDLPLMSKLLDALPEECRLTLVGDEHQLASVDRGRVFGDLCHLPWVKTSRLSVSKRFKQGGEIARLADAVNGGDASGALSCLAANAEKARYQRLDGLDAFNPGSWGDFRPLVEDGFKGFVTSTKPEDALEHLNDFRVLCALRSGAYGADRINDYILKTLAGSAAHPSCPVPLMITKNDRSLGVANGDVGVLMPDKPHELFLPVEDGSCRMVRVELLDSTEVAFATTIHKSQGSEFNDVAIVLPPEGESPLLTREILYTGITRTRKTVHVYAGDASIRKCCEKTVERVSGLSSATKGV